MPYGSTTQGMLFGAVAMIDALGFKGIWTEERAKGRWTPQDVIAKMSEVKEIADQQKDHILQRFPAVDADVHLGVRTIMVSDTLLVFVHCTPKNFKPFEPLPDANDEQNATMKRLTEIQWHLRSFACLKLCVEIVARSIGAALIRVPELNFRGAITVGDFALGDDVPFYLGPAIDKCADAYERPKGAFVIFCQPAKEFYEDAQTALKELEDTAKTIGFHIDDHHDVVSIPEVLLFSVPCKKSPTETVVYETYVVNPLAKWTSDSWKDRSDKAIELITGESSSIAEYRENTKALMERILRSEGLT